MSDPGDGATRVAVVAPGDRRTPLVAALSGESGVTVTDDDRLDDALSDESLDCVVCSSAAAYEQLRESDEATPVVVAADLDRGDVETVVGDPRADHVRPGADLATTLPVRLAHLVEVTGSTTAWRLADFADEAVVEFDPETLALREANERFYERWGWNEADLAGSTIEDLLVTDITHELRGQGRGASGEEELEWIDDEDAVASMVERARGGNYETREWHCNATDGTAFKTEVDLVVDERGGTGYLVATVPEPSDDRTGDGPLDHDEAAMLRSLVEHVPMSVYFKDDRSRHVLVSDDVVEPFIESPEGKIIHTPEGVHGKTDFDLYEMHLAEEAVEDDRQVIESGEPIRNRVEHAQPPNGRDLFYQTTKAPWYDSDGVAQGIIGVTVDITDQKHRERELDRQNERLDEFASIVSHDLRNPLNVAQGRLDLYRQSGDESELDAVEEMHERIESIIEEVLAYAREGSHIEEMEWFDATDVAAGAWEGVATAAASFDQNWEYAIKGDPSRLARLFENLFRNAVEHGGEDVTVRVGTLDDVPGFYVEDDGPGIPEAERDEVFERGVTTNEDGTGFGLAIVREIAEAHGWSVQATDGEQLPGARFEFTGVTRGE
ncbi:PAS domain-containing sensor histidine kinase [Halosimplex salinum]|uniref:PAS domain-containing sensor histidine kinase n=1 Tax=Halosimplex salinum TaxID=1710538 RepID=UPI000F4A3C0C|nr:PAS domain-containing sensor histidine kinase [Halosimplex salinum]